MRNLFSQAAPPEFMPCRTGPNARSRKFRRPSSEAWWVGYLASSIMADYDSKRPPLNLTSRTRD